MLKKGEVSVNNDLLQEKTVIRVTIADVVAVENVIVVEDGIAGIETDHVTGTVGIVIEARIAIAAADVIVAVIAGQAATEIEMIGVVVVVGMRSDAVIAAEIAALILAGIVVVSERVGKMIADEVAIEVKTKVVVKKRYCLLYTSPSPRDRG